MRAIPGQRLRLSLALLLPGAAAAGSAAPLPKATVGRMEAIAGRTWWRRMRTSRRTPGRLRQRQSNNTLSFPAWRLKPFF